MQSSPVPAGSDCSVVKSCSALRGWRAVIQVRSGAGTGSDSRMATALVHSQAAAGIWKGEPTRTVAIPVRGTCTQPRRGGGRAEEFGGVDDDGGLWMAGAGGGELFEQAQGEPAGPLVVGVPQGPQVQADGLAFGQDGAGECSGGAFRGDVVTAADSARVRTGCDRRDVAVSEKDAALVGDGDHPLSVAAEALGQRAANTDLPDPAAPTTRRPPRGRSAQSGEASTLARLVWGWSAALEARCSRVSAQMAASRPTWSVRSPVQRRTAAWFAPASSMCRARSSARATARWRSE